MAWVRFRAFDTYVVATRRERLETLIGEGFERVQGSATQRVVGMMLERVSRPQLAQLWQDIFGTPLSPRLQRADIEQQLLGAARERTGTRLVCLVRKDERHPAHTLEQPPIELSAAKLGEAPAGHIMWIGFELIDQQDEALGDAAFVLEAPDKALRTGRLDAHGRTRHDPTLDGSFRFALTRADRDEVELRNYLSIELVNEGGEPIPAAQYQLVVGGMPLRKGTTDQEGRVHITDLPPGPYELVLPELEPSAVSCEGKVVQAASGALRTAKSHEVKQGDTLAKIAKAYGLRNWRALYDAPENEALRKKRPNPHRIRPRDQVRIPAAKAASVSLEAGGSVRLSVHGEPYSVVTWTVTFPGDLVEQLPADVVLELTGPEHGPESVALSEGERADGFFRFKFAWAKPGTKVTLVAKHGTRSVRLVNDACPEAGIGWEGSLEALLEESDAAGSLELQYVAGLDSAQATSGDGLLAANDEAFGDAVQGWA